VRRAAAAVAALIALAGCGSDDGPRTDDVVDSVPADARAYLHLDRDAEDWQVVRDALDDLPALEGALATLLPRSAEPPAEGEVGLALLPGQEEALAVGPDDPDAPTSLAESDEYTALLDELPDGRFAHAYLAPAAVRALRVPDRTTRSAAGAADVSEDLLRVHAVARHSNAGGGCPVAHSGSDLVDLTDPQAALYVEVASLRCMLESLTGTFPSVDAAFAEFTRAAEARGELSVPDDLLPLLDRPAALSITPGDAAPVLTLVLDGVDEAEALDVLALLQPGLIDLIGARRFGQAPTFGSVDVEGVTVATAQVAPGLELSYAAWDGRLVVSTALDGIAAARRAEGLGGAAGFDAVVGDSSSPLSALLFIDLQQLLTLGEQAGLAQDPRYLAVRDDLHELGAVGVVVSREEEFTTAELTFQIP